MIGAVEESAGVGGGGDCADAAVVIERFGGTTPENVTDGARGERGAEVALDEDFAGGRQDEEGLDHGSCSTVGGSWIFVWWTP